MSDNIIPNSPTIIRYIGHFQITKYGIAGLLLISYHQLFELSVGVHYYRTSSMPVAWMVFSFPTHLREMQFRPAGFIALSLDAGLPPHRCFAAFQLPSGKVMSHSCCYITTRLLFLFKLVMESPFGLRSLPVAIRQSDVTPRHF